MVGKGSALERLQFHHAAKEEAGDRHKNISSKKKKKMYKDIQAWAMPATILPVYIKRKVYVHPFVSQFVMLNVLAS